MTAICEICFKEGNLDLAKEALKNVPENDKRIELLMEF